MPFIDFSAGFQWPAHWQFRPVETDIILQDFTALLCVWMWSTAEDLPLFPTMNNLSKVIMAFARQFILLFYGFFHV